MHVEFREANSEDIPGIVALVNSAYRGEGSKKGWTTEADLLDGLRTDDAMIGSMIEREDSIILLCEEEDPESEFPEPKLLGCVHLEKQGSSMYLGMLTVDPTLQRGGIGSELLEEAEVFADFWDCQQIEMTVISSRLELISYYERRGFKNTLEKKPFPTGNPAFGIPKTPLEFIVMKKPVRR